MCHADFLLRRPNRKSPSESSRCGVVINEQCVITPPQDTDKVDTLSTLHGALNTTVKSLMFSNDHYE